jgi:xanthine dehydrogenase accessory factor
MKELQDILHSVERMPPGSRAILATVVDVQGSGYRLAGARMLIDESGNSIGSVSGGCLEADVLEWAKRVFRDGEPSVVVYDSTKDENSIFGLQMGCRGIVRIMLEPIGRDALLDFIHTCYQNRKTGTIATLVAKSDDLEAPIASRFFWQDEWRMVDPGLKSVFESFLPFLTKDVEQSLRENRSRSISYKTPLGDAEFFIEIIQPPTTLLIFGAGHDAVPLSCFAKELGLRVKVIDRRPTYATNKRFPGAGDVLVARPEDLEEEFFSDEPSVAVVMSHNFEADKEAVRRLINSRCSYIGILGPKQRTANLLQELAEDGAIFDADLLERIYAPAGLDIGATTPEGIAFSIVAEIQSVLADRKGGFLKLRTKPIYDR